MSDKAARRHPQAKKRNGRRPVVGHRASGGLPAPTCTMPAIASSGSPAEIYALFDPDLSGGYSGSLDPFVVRTALTLLTRIIGLPLAAIDLAPPRFSVRFPKHERPEEAREVIGPQMPRYQSWRRIILDAQMLATRGPVDQDPWDGLRRVARLTMGEQASEALRAAERHSPGTVPAGLTLARAIEIEAGLPSTQRGSFRRAIRILSDLHDHDLAVATGLLPPRFGPLPPRDRFQNHLPLPPRLAAAVADEPAAARASAGYCWTVAVRAGLIPADADPAPAEFLDGGPWQDLSRVDPAAHGLELTRGTWGVYLRQLAKILIAAGAPDPRRATVAGAWAALCTAVRATGRRTEVLSSIAAPAKDAGLRPSDITAAWIADRMASLSIKQRNALRSACLLLDATRYEEVIPAHLLPSEPTGMVRQSRQSPHPREMLPKPLVAPVEQAWIDLFAAMRRAGASGADLHPVYAVRSEAIGRGLPPGDVDLAWIERWRAESDTARATRFACAARLLDKMREHPGLADHLPASRIGAPEDRRRSAAGLPAGIAADLAALLRAQGAGASTKRAASIAVRALADALAARSASLAATSLVQLLRADTAGLDWGRNADQAPTHEGTVGRLRAFHDLPWTPAWRRLQTAVVAAGVSMRDNPIPALLRRAGSRDPLELDLAWARAVDRSLRREGRADLALTFANDLGRLDALHARAELARSGLLPPRFGPIREKPAAQTAPAVRPESDPVADAWVALAAAVRATGRKADILSMIAPRAKVAGLRPQDLTAAWFAAMLSTLSAQQAKATRSACFLLDDLRADPRVPAGLLPIGPTGIVRRNARRCAA
jgi:hypothetical protein